MTKILNQDTKKKIINHLYSRYGIDKEYFEEYLFIIKGNSVSVIYFEKKKEINTILKDNFVKNIGIELFSNYKKYTPSSLGFGMFSNKEIKNNYVVLDREKTIEYFKNKELDIKEIKEKKLLSSGYVVCVYDGYIVGTGEYIKEKNKIYPNLSYVNDKIK